MLFAIDAGTFDSAYVLMDDNYNPIEFDIIKNSLLLSGIYGSYNKIDHCVIEMISSYGLPVGTEVFETCVFIGQIMATCDMHEIKNSRIYRKDVKMHICGSMKSKDSDIRSALMDRFGDVGTKKNKGFFYGFKADIWQAYALGVTYLDKKNDSK